ncbi:MAG: flagellar basal body protein, partial [Defluviitaleaceae bacterium]|nr:flagellar basal body protein [Defluviitaleaceae bacterium]
MNSAFFGLHIATSALNTSRANLHTIGHNIANAETPGFSRQVAVQQASTPLRGSGARGMIGTGSQITTISQIRNVAIDKRFWHQSSVLGQFSKKNEIMALTRGILREREDTEGQGLGFNHEFNSIFNRIHQLNVDATSMTNRANLMSAFESLAIHMNNSYASMMQQQIDTNAEIGSMVGIINSLGRQISTLNRQIAGFEMTGANANDLRDQRARLIDELSTYVNIDVQEIETNPDFAAGRISDPSQSRRETIILINGSMFVNHTRLEQLEVRQRQSGVTSVSRNLEEPPGMY